MIDPLIGSTLLGVGGSLVSSGLNQLFNKGSSAKAYSRQRNLMALEQQYARANWQMENAYNSPQAQMQRLKAAGLNPDLIYGNGAAGLQGGSVGDPGTGSSPQQAPADFDLAAGVMTALQAESLALDNEEKRQSLKAKKDKYENLVEEGVDENGDPVVTLYAPTNYWQDERKAHRMTLKQQATAIEDATLRLEILRATAPALKQMTNEQLNSLIEDVKAKRISNVIAEGEKAVYERYGIKSDDSNYVATLARMCMRNPDALAHVLDAVVLSAKKGISHAVDGLIAGYEKVIHK